MAPEMDTVRRGAKMATSRLFLSSPRGSLGSFIPLRMVSQGFYHRPDRFRGRFGPRAAVLWPSEAPKPVSRIPNPPADSALRYWCFGGVPRAPARLTACLVVVLKLSQGFPRAAKRLAVLLLACRGRRGRRGGSFARYHAAKWAT